MKIFQHVSLVICLFIMACSDSTTSVEPAAETLAEPVAKAVQQIPTPSLGDEAIAVPPATPPPISPPPAVPESPPIALESPTTTPSTPPISPELQALPAPALPPPEIQVPPKEAETIPFTPKLVKTNTNIALLLDGSGSMSAPFGNSVLTKFQVQREAVASVLKGVSTATDLPRNIGLRTFGTQSPAPQQNCQDSLQLYPMGEVSLANVMASFLEPTPKGMSPLAHSLAEAIKDFPQLLTGERLIVLVADGKDNCGEDPCAKIREIEAAVGKVMVHVIGFDISPEDREQLECIARAGDGKFHFARTENELRSSLEEAINAIVPYNLKLSTSVAGSPLPVEVTVYRAGAQQEIRREQSYGTKLMKLEPGTYDLEIEYQESPLLKKPSKVIKGVEILADTKVEQQVAFDLTELTLIAFDEEGKEIGARYRFLAPGSSEELGKLQSDAKATLFLTPGTVDIVAERIDAPPEQFTVGASGVALTAGQTIEKEFRFQRGEIAFKGKTTQGNPLPFLFRLVKTETETVIASGALPAEGGSISVAPGSYDIMLIGQDPQAPADPRTKVSRIEVTAATTTDVPFTFEMGLLVFEATNSKKDPLAATFTLRSGADVLTTVAYDGKQKKQLPIPPGTYDIIAELTQANAEPKPSVPLKNIVVTAEKPVEVSALFALGMLRLRGRDSKEHPITTEFTLYQSGETDPLMQAKPSQDWIDFAIPPGSYDIQAKNAVFEEGKEPAVISVRNVRVEEGKTISHEAIFTAGKLKIIGRGPNNKIITCSFKVFEYGADRELIYGNTGDDWEVFDLNPGKYYIEASYVDPAASQLLKKWINVTVGDNEVVEQVLRF